MTIGEALRRQCPELDMVSLVFHTGCVNYDHRELQELEDLGIPWLIPDNVRVELELLRDKSERYRVQAGWILAQAGKSERLGVTGEGRPWDLEELYQNRKGDLQPDAIDWGSLIFLFGNEGKMYEFAQHCVPLPGHYLLWQRGGDMRVRSMNHRELEQMRQEAARHWSGSQVRELGKPAHVEPLKNLRRIRWVNVSGTEISGTVPGEMFRSTDKNGTYARLYTLYKWPGAMVKIYKHQMGLVDNGSGKLRALCEAADELKELPLAMPRILLDTEDGRIRIGYAMRRFAGEPLLNRYFNGWDGYDLPEILRQIAWILLELHCRDILVNDLSYNNILLNEADGRVSIVDCDSFQIGPYPGGRMTESYQHPEIRTEACDSTLHQPRHEYFAFAVLVYQCGMLADPLSICGGNPEQTPNWSNTDFPLEWDTQTSHRVNGKVLKAWVEQDERFRRVMADIFHFRGDHSVGAILRESELI